HMGDVVPSAESKRQRARNPGARASGERRGGGEQSSRGEELVDAAAQALARAAAEQRQAGVDLVAPLVADACGGRDDGHFVELPVVADRALDAAGAELRGEHR